MGGLRTWISFAIIHLILVEKSSTSTNVALNAKSKSNCDNDFKATAITDGIIGRKNFDNHSCLKFPFELEIELQPTTVDYAIVYSKKCPQNSRLHGMEFGFIYENLKQTISCSYLYGKCETGLVSHCHHHLPLDYNSIQKVLLIDGGQFSVKHNIIIKEMEVRTFGGYKSKIFLGCATVDDTDSKPLDSNDCLEECYVKKFNIAMIRDKTTCLCSSKPITSWTPLDQCIEICDDGFKYCGGPTTFAAYGVYFPRPKFEGCVQYASAPSNPDHQTNEPFECLKHCSTKNITHVLIKDTDCFCVGTVGTPPKRRSIKNCLDKKDQYYYSFIMPSFDLLPTFFKCKDDNLGYDYTCKTGCQDDLPGRICQTAVTAEDDDDDDDVKPDSGPDSKTDSRPDSKIDPGSNRTENDGSVSQAVPYIAAAVVPLIPLGVGAFWVYKFLQKKKAIPIPALNQDTQSIGAAAETKE